MVVFPFSWSNSSSEPSTSLTKGASDGLTFPSSNNSVEKDSKCIPPYPGSTDAREDYHQEPPLPSSSSEPNLKSSKLVGSRILHKLHLTPTSPPSKKPDDKAAEPRNDRSGSSSGTQTPAIKFQESDYGKFIAESELDKALLDEVQERKQAKRRWSNIGRLSRQSSQAICNENKNRGATTPEYIADEPVDLSRFESEASKHFPGDLYGSERKSSRPPTGEGHRQSSSTHQSPALGNKELPEDAEDEYSDTELDHAFEGRPSLERRCSDHSGTSDDTITHLMNEASHYDLVRRAAINEGHSYHDASIKELAAKQSESLSDYKSERSAANGGASSALRKPLLELEEVELENFLYNFARHTKQVKVPNTRERKARRMPQWSDFKISHDDDPESMQKKRTKLLTRIDRGLQTVALEDKEEVGPVDSSGCPIAFWAQGLDHTPAEDRAGLSTGLIPPASTQSRPNSDVSHDDLEHFSASEASVKVKKEKAKPFRKKKASVRSSLELEHVQDEDWDLIVPSGSDAIPAGNLKTDELRVDVQEEQVDGIAFCIAYLLALVERFAPEEIDYSPDHGYREGILRSHIERLYTIAPFWEQLGFKIRKLYRWEDPTSTGAAAMIYFILWYTDMIPSTFLMLVMWFIMRFKYFPPSESYLHEKVQVRMARGQAANKLSEKLRRQSRLDLLNIYKRWAATYGPATQEAAGILADFHEKAKNLILWRNPQATQRSLIVFGFIIAFVTFASAHLVWKTAFFGFGITFFCLLPLQSYFPTHRKALCPIWWVMFGAPTDAQFATQLLRKRHLDIEFNSAQDLRKTYKRHKSTPRPDKREDAVRPDEIDNDDRAGQDFVGTSSSLDVKPRKLGSFFCQYKGLPGRLHVNTRYLYFTPLHNGSLKRGHTSLSDVGGLTKTKNIRLYVWNSLGLKVARTNGKAPLLFANVQNRDEAFNLILAVCSTN